MSKRSTTRDGHKQARAAAPASLDRLNVEAHRFRDHRRSTLRSFVDAFLPALGLTIRDERWWVAP